MIISASRTMPFQGNSRCETFAWNAEAGHSLLDSVISSWVASSMEDDINEENSYQGWGMREAGVANGTRSGPARVWGGSIVNSSTEMAAVAPIAAVAAITGTAADASALARMADRDEEVRQVGRGYDGGRGMLASATWASASGQRRRSAMVSPTTALLSQEVPAHPGPEVMRGGVSDQSRRRRSAVTFSENEIAPPIPAPLRSLMPAAAAGRDSPRGTRRWSAASSACEFLGLGRYGEDKGRREKKDRVKGYQYGIFATT